MTCARPPSWPARWLVVAVLAGPVAMPARAEIYTCKDPSGRSLTSDRPIPECARRPMRELAEDGSLRREIAAPLTREEREQRERELQRQRNAEEAVRQQVALDRATLLSYPTLDALEAARRRAIEVIEAQIAMSQRRMADLHVMLDRAEGKRDTRLVRSLAQSILAEDADNARRRGEIEQIEARFDEDAQRLRRALAGTGTRVEGPSGSRVAVR